MKAYRRGGCKAETFWTVAQDKSNFSPPYLGETLLYPLNRRLSEPQSPSDIMVKKNILAPARTQLLTFQTAPTQFTN
jgi:hypothetical protein